MKKKTHTIPFSQWTSIADMLSIAFMVFTSLFFITGFQSVTQLNQLRQLQDEKEDLQKERDTLKGEKTELEKKNNELTEQLKRSNDQPPMIPLSEASNYSFKTDSAIIGTDCTTAFEKDQRLQQIKEIIQKYNIDVIQIVGHTDAREIKRQIETLDKKLECVVSGDEAIAVLEPSSNADLGLMRALSVKLFLEERLSSSYPAIQYRVYSAAQLGQFVGQYPLPSEVSCDNFERQDEPSRRRIELYFTKSK